MLLIHAIFIIFIMIAFVIDVRQSKLPNKLTMCGTLFGILFHTWSQGWEGFLFSLVGALIGFLALLMLYLLELEHERDTLDLQ